MECDALNPAGERELRSTVNLYEDRTMWRLALGISLVVVGCSSSSGSSTGGAGAGAGGDSERPDDTGDAGASDSGSQGGTAGSLGGAGEANSGGDPGASGGSVSDAPPLPEGTLLYVHSEEGGRDVLLAADLESGEQRVVTDLTGDGSSGWSIDGYSLSPDRRRIALASLYAPTKADTATGLATNAIWTLDTLGEDFRRLTPTFPNEAAGRQNFQYDVGNPEWTADGSFVIFDFGTYWWEGTSLAGGSYPWAVAADGKSLPMSLDLQVACSVLYPSRNPVTGDFLLIHSVCVPGQSEGDGIFYYSAEGDTEPTQVIRSSHTDGNVDVFLTKPSWFSDGSGFLFVGGIADTDWRPSLLLYEAESGDISSIVPAPEGTGVRSVAVSPDSSKIVFCLYDTENESSDLHLIDLSAESPTVVALTDDGSSCDPVF